jgi:tetratricopeptide (TPR) repeat protein
MLSLLLMASVAELHAQQPAAGDPPTPLVPLKAQTRQELDRREACKLYGLALLHQRHDRILEAVRTLEQALQLDAEAAPIFKALVPLYLALSRADDALTACRKALDQDPGDHTTWYAYSRLLKEQSRPKEAATALARAVACPSLKEQPELLVQADLDLGSLYEEIQDYAQAESAFGEAAKLLDRPELLLENGPFTREQIAAEAAKTYERIGRVCILAKQYARAEVAFRTAQQRDPDRAARLSYNLAEVCVAQDRLTDALRYLDQYLRTQPPGTEAYELRITLLNRLGRSREILPSLQDYASRDEHNVALQLLLAQQYGKERHWDEAESRYLKLAMEGPSPDIYRGLFTVYRNQGRSDKVLELLDAALVTAGKEGPAAQVEAAGAAARARAMLVVLRDDPELIKAMLPAVVKDLLAGRERAPETRRFLAVLAARTHQLDAAEQLYTDCLRHLTPQTESEVYGGLLDVLWEARKLAEIERMCRKGLQEAQATNRAMFHVNLAEALVQLGKATEAIEQADKAVELSDDRNRLRIRRMRVNVLTLAERYDQAVAECEAMLKEVGQPGEARDIRYTLSSVYSAAHDYPKAEEQLRQILEIDPKDATANNDLGYIMADQGKNLEEAEKLIRKAIDLDLDQKKPAPKVRPDDDHENANAAYLDSLGWVLFRRGQTEAARGWLEKASGMSGGAEDPVVWDHLGDVYYKLEQPARARTAWTKALDLYEKEKRRKTDGHYNELKNKLKLLEQASQQ